MESGPYLATFPWMALVAVLVATVVAFFLGGLWYSPLLFGRMWMKEAGLKEDECGKRPKAMALVLGSTFVLTLISTILMAFFLGPKPGIGYGIEAGLFIGLGWVATSIGTNFLFDGRSFKLYAITTGYHVVRFVVTGAILGLLQ